MDKPNKSFLGTGWSFPPSFSDHTNSLNLVKEEKDIRQSLVILMATIPGERVMRPNYGCDLHRMVFERLNNTTTHRIIDLVKVAVLRYEPRITVDRVEVNLTDPEIGLIHITLYYTVRKTNVRTNIVYPFYFKEGTNVRSL